MTKQYETSRTEFLNAEGAETAEEIASSHTTSTPLHSLRSLPSLRFILLVNLFMCSAALAGDGIVVRGSGSASARPTEVEMSGTISAEAELAADAIVKFRDAKKRALAALDGLKNPDLKVVPGGLSVGGGMDANQQMMVMRGMAAPATGQKVRLSETMKITLAHADKIAADELMDKLLKILDVAKDAGFQIGQAPASNYYEAMIRAETGDSGSGATVSFRLPDSSALRDKAYQAAIDDAKAKAQKLADASGAKLGRIASVRDEGAPKQESETSNLAMMIYGAVARKASPEETVLSGGTSGELTLHVNLTVQFEIAK